MFNYVSDDIKEIPIDDICNILMGTIFNKGKVDEISKENDFHKQYTLYKALADECAEEIMNASKKVRIKVSINITRFESQLFKIIKLIYEEEDLKVYFEKRLKDIIYREFDFPF